MATTINIQQNPFDLFHDWYGEAQKLDLKEPTAMTLATSTPDGKPSCRVILLKGINEKGFAFFTNLTSRKGEELIKNPHAALCFYWEALGKQIRIEGKVEQVTEKEADDYFTTRRRGSQLGAWASHQSAPMESENDLIKRVETVTEQYGDGPIPRPPFWSGFRLIPNRIEFWQEGEYRLHTRIVYSRTESGWDITRIYP